MKNLEIFSKYLPKHPDKSFIAEMQFDRETDCLNIIAKLHNFGRFSKIRFKQRDSL